MPDSVKFKAKNCHLMEILIVLSAIIVNIIIYDNRFVLRNFIRTFNKTDLFAIKTEFITEFQVDKNMMNADIFYVNNNNKVCILLTC